MKQKSSALLLSLGMPLLMSANVSYHAFGKEVTLQPLHEQKALGEKGIKWYLSPSGQKLGVKNEVIIGCDDEKACRALLTGYPVAKIEKLSETLYLLTLEQGSDPFEIANRLYEEPAVSLAHPNFIKKRQLR